jgi:hypothetical protein
VELQQYLGQFRKQGLGICSISYDSVAILADFAERKNITFPLLADPQSEVIRAFGVLRTNWVPKDPSWNGAAYAVIFRVDRNGIVRSKYFAEQSYERYSTPTVLLREFGSVAGTRETSVKTDQLELKYYSTSDVVRANLHLTLVADFDLKPKMHVYAPEVQHYIPLQITLDPSPYYTVLPAEYPKPEVLYLAPIQETLPVYQGRFRITQDVTIAGDKVLQPLFTGEQEIRVRGHLRYQVCDDKICYLPQNTPVEWLLKAQPLDEQRSPEAIQRRAPPQDKKEISR